MNKVMIMGRLTRDPEVRSTLGGKSVSNFTLAVDRRVYRQGEEKTTDFIPVVAWDKLADFCGNYFKKGRQVAIIGRMQIRSWVDDNDVKRYTTEIVSSEAYFADSKKVVIDNLQDESNLEHINNVCENSNNSYNINETPQCLLPF